MWYTAFENGLIQELIKYRTTIHRVIYTEGFGTCSEETNNWMLFQGGGNDSSVPSAAKPLLINRTDIWKCTKVQAYAFLEYTEVSSLIEMVHDISGCDFLRWRAVNKRGKAWKMLLALWNKVIWMRRIGLGWSVYKLQITLWTCWEEVVRSTDLRNQFPDHRVIPTWEEVCSEC